MGTEAHLSIPRARGTPQVALLPQATWRPVLPTSPQVSAGVGPWPSREPEPRVPAAWQGPAGTRAQCSGLCASRPESQGANQHGLPRLLGSPSARLEQAAGIAGFSRGLAGPAEEVLGRGVFTFYKLPLQNYSSDIFT